MSEPNFHPLKDPELFFQNVVEVFEKNGIDKHFQASFLYHIAEEIQKSSNYQFRPLKTQPFRRSLTDEYAMQIALHYLISKNLNLTMQCGQTELPAFKVYNTPTTIFENLHLKMEPSTWLLDILVDRKKQLNKMNNDTEPEQIEEEEEASSD